MELGVVLFALVIVVYGALAIRLDRWSLTMPMVFVLVGFLLGPGVAGLLPVTMDAAGLRELTEITLGVLLFADASTLDMAQARLDARLPLRLLLIGLPLTMLLGVVTGMLVLPGIDLAFAVLLGTLLAPTDAALGLPIYNNLKVPVRIRRALNIESGLNDGLATPFVTLAIAFAVATEQHEGHSWLSMALVELGVGVLVGVAVGALGGRLLVIAQRRQWTSLGPARLAVLGLALVAFFGARTLGGNGFIAAFIGGLVLGSVTRGRIAEPADFTEQCGTVLSIAVWGVFGAAMLPVALHLTADLRPILYAVLSLTFVRMVPVAIALVGNHFRRDTVALMGWFGPRGLASVVFTLLAFTELEASGNLDATLLTVATWTILLSVMAHGLSAGPLAAWYARRLAAAEDPHHELQDLPELYERRAILTAQTTGRPPAEEGIG